MNTEENKIAILIDAENVSYNDIDMIFTEIKRNGKILISRIYGSVNAINKWQEACTKYSIDIRTQFNFVSGKNTSDSKLIIDAMDILYTKDINTFYIVSSDSDFTGLIMRIKEDNKVVIGVGEQKTPEALINACNKFVFIENLRPVKEEKVNNKKSKTTKTKSSVTPYETIKNEILNLVENSEENTLHVSRVKELIQNIYPDFDPRNYNKKKFSEFLSAIKELKVTTAKDGTTKFVSLNCSSDNLFKSSKCILSNHVEAVITPDDLGSSIIDNDIDEVKDENKLPTEEELLKTIKEIILNSKDEKINKSQFIEKIKKLYPKFTYKAFKVNSYSAFLNKYKDVIKPEDKNDRVKKDYIVLVKK